MNLPGSTINKCLYTDAILIIIKVRNAIKIEISTRRLRHSVV